MVSTTSLKFAEVKNVRDLAKIVQGDLGWHQYRCKFQHANSNCQLILRVTKTWKNKK
jgi:hypothetical protein